ncbi:MAG: agmatinase family protein [Gemmatimonadales bacterium]
MTDRPFDPNAPAAAGAGLFGLPHTRGDAAVQCLPVPWEATTSYGAGTAGGPAAILRASWQVDLFDLEVERPYEAGIVMLPASPEVSAWNAEARPLARQVIELGGAIGETPALHDALAHVNELSARLNAYVQAETATILDEGRIPGIVGGDHSTPFGAIRAAADRYPGLGLLQIDAHMDLREAYEGFTWSHASITRNVVDAVPGVTSVVQVGIRDFCEEEVECVAEHGSRIQVWYDQAMAARRFRGDTWDALVTEIIAPLPREVWITFDIDGLDPKLCPGTGTPVPGGLEFAEAVHLIAAVARSGRRIVGFDLNEVAPGEDEWDANVGARMLYKLCAWALASQGRARERG